MTESIIPILAIDDEPGNLEIITDYLEDAGYKVITATDGESALELLAASPEKFQAILLDWMMPGMDGMEVLKKLKSNPELQHIPVIMQTARTAHEDLLKGMRAGAFYYLTKPYQEHTLCTILAAAISDGQRYTALHHELRQGQDTLRLLNQAQFKFRTLDDARNVAACISRATPTPEKVLMGLSELLINAVEHGNLGITYQDKTQLNEKGEWHDEVLRRLELPEYKDKVATLEFLNTGDKFTFTITDQGSGFEPGNYLEMDPARAYDSHGRGIYMAKLMSFDHIEYRQNGTCVVASVHVEKS